MSPNSKKRKSYHTVGAELGPVCTKMCTKFDSKYDLGILRGL